MNKNIVIALILVLVILGGGYFLFIGNTEVPLEENTQVNNEPINNSNNLPQGDENLNEEDPVTTKSYEIVYTDNGYAPSEITIKAGDTVTFKNESSRNVWTASAMHPSHTVYAGTSLQQHCSQEINEAFDECKDSKTGESWSFTFKKTGTWGYHNHSFASHFGKVIVQ